jgi:DNA polymerase I-like protein with 3'-5' exonuclease and polymerase domains
VNSRDITKVPRRLITTEAQLASLVRDIQNEIVYACDTEYSTINKYNKTVDIAGMSFYLPKKNVAYYIPINHSTIKEQIPLEAVRNKLQFMAKRDGPAKSLWHNFKADYQTLYQHGIDVWDHKLDTFMGSYLLDDNAKGHFHGLKYLSRKLFNYNQVDYDAVTAIAEIRRSKKLRTLFKLDRKVGLYQAFEQIQDKLYRIDQKMRLQISEIDRDIKQITSYGDNTEKEQLKVKALKKAKTEIRRNEYVKTWKQLTSNKHVEEKRIHDVSIDLVLPYATDDVICTYLLYRYEKEKLSKIDQYDHACNYQTRLAKVLARIEMRGVPIDLKAVKAELKVSTQKLDEIDAKIQRYVMKKGWQYTTAKEFAKDGRVLKIGSGPQISRLLFKDLKIRPGGKTKGNKPKTDFATLSNIEHKVAGWITEWRKESKIRSTYLLNLIERAVKDKHGVWRIHPTFNQYGAATGRLSSKEPNFQNMPSGPRIRKFFIAPKLWRMMVLDYSQLELRILACFSKDKMLTKAYASGKAIDIHAYTAALIFKVVIEEVLVEEGQPKRKKAKTMNFGIIYQMGVDKLARSLNITTLEAQEFIDAYFETFNGVDKWIKNQIEFIKENAHSTTLLGRRRRFPYLKHKSVRSNPGAVSRAARQGVNAPIQGTGQDICGGAMIRIEYEFYDDPDFEMNGQVHDELVCLSKKSKAKKSYKVVKTCMEYPFKPGEPPLSPIPLVVEGKIGSNWSECKE